ncbi:hypothetical protein IIE18_10925 [Pseudomonas sp. V1]|uniref:hypothetical protein n=1 Tax=Pseudomonas arcuscaelestis TaxID=2710591 RepID=UPI00193F6999|nr:hypothetical protein [Pseudomonas arcuscaelestis]MBM3105652.1 hypothetical protein [Pseudomonas arcuscaelestis]
MIFEAGDSVSSTSNPFWMTVIETNPNTGRCRCRCRCRFGAVGGYAGSIHQNQLEFFGGFESLGQRQIDALLEQCS